MNHKRVIKKIFSLPAAIIVVWGEWKSGKTDFALRLSEEAKKMGLVKRVASNIETTNSDVECIQNMPALERWMFKDTISKLYIYDEAMASTLKRNAMTRLNKAWHRVIPELSKGRVKLIVVTQDPNKTEGIFGHRTFLRAVFKKLSKKTAYVNSGLLPEGFDLKDIPRTTIKFDPFLRAPFFLEDEAKLDKLDEETKVALLYSRGMGMDDIGKQLTPVRLHRNQVRRLLRRYLRVHFKKLSYQLPSISEEEGKPAESNEKT